MKKANPNSVYTCYGCKQFYPIGGKPVEKFSPVIHCGGNRYECSYFLGIGQPDVGVMRRRKMLQNEI